MLCFRLFSENNPAVPLADAVAQLREGQAPKDLYSVEPASFQQIPNAPFAYWVSERIRRLFVEMPAFEGEGRTVRQGLATASDFRFVRTKWEVPSVQGNRVQERWFSFAKGGSYAQYYADIHLAVNWQNDGSECKAYIVQRYPYLNGNAAFVAKNTEFYFKPGLTWSLRSQIGLGVRILPQDCVFGHKGPLATGEFKELDALLALGTSSPFRGLVELQMSFGAYEVGVISRTVVPKKESPKQWKAMAASARKAWSAKRWVDRGNMVSSAFYCPLLVPGGQPKKIIRS
jgi:hypothetical protein